MMAWDLALDGVSGDFLFGGNRDLLGVMDAPLVNQRIIIRCRIPLGSFQDDDTETLGSTIPLMDGSLHANEKELISAIEAALEPMTDIQVQNIEVVYLDENGVAVDSTDPNVDPSRRLVNVQWTPASAIDEPADESDPAQPVFDATIPVSP